MAGLCKSHAKTYGQSAMGFEGFILGFGIYMTHKKKLGPKKPVQTA